MTESNRELAELLGELTGAIEELQSELEPSPGRLRPPTPRELTRFTSEVTIPALILVLETNVRALRLVQRALRLAEGREPEPGRSSTRERATALGQATVDRLDDVLTDLQDALAARPPDGETRQLLERVQDLQSEIDAQLQQEPTSEAATMIDDSSPDEATDEDTTRVDVDVDAELRSLKDDLDDDNSDEGENTND